MQTFILIILMFAVSRWLAGRFAWGYFLGGLVFGLYNEIVLEFCWNYSPKLGPTLWRDIPIAVVIGWGANFLFALSVTDRLSRVFKLNWVLCRVCDIAVFAAYAGFAEYLMIKLGYWSYNFPEQLRLSIQVFSWISIGLFVSAAGRFLQGAIDNRAQRKIG